MVCGSRCCGGSEVRSEGCLTVETIELWQGYGTGAGCMLVHHGVRLHHRVFFFFFSSRRRHTRSDRDWSSDVCSSDLMRGPNGSVPRMPITIGESGWAKAADGHSTNFAKL